MASEAQRLIGISLTKIAQSRSHRGGVSLHKNLLVATVLQKARYIFMEEAYNMVHYQSSMAIQTRLVASEKRVIGLTTKEAGLLISDVQQSSASSGNLQELLQTSCVKCAENLDKENHPPYNSSQVTYLDLDKNSNVLCERSKTPSLKRRRAVAEWETEEAVQSILPKRSKQVEESEVHDDSVFLDDATLLSDVVSREVDAASERNHDSNGGSAMEIDRITSLVSIFSFSMGDGKLNRSMSTPDLCSAQANDIGNGLQQRPFLAMTV
ncbi:hypothetical protein NQ315_014429 [Exocentrus adspersus]|uniref:Uncharacterized protein n=1 Tax=Exocentrus adspersus TaxID=1586481 RepID=A0AAV8VB99_9CUCU|nr:hypothetical protein NQ315_014429 [Exocentrus adspersus]